MKKFLSVVLVAVLAFGFSGIASADQTGTSFWHNHSYTDTNTDSYVDKYSEYEENRSNPLGIGLDVTLYEFEGNVQEYGLDDVEFQNKYDIANGEYSGYLVVQCSIWRLGEKLFGR